MHIDFRKERVFYLETPWIRPLIYTIDYRYFLYTFYNDIDGFSGTIKKIWATKHEKLMEKIMIYCMSVKEYQNSEIPIQLIPCKHFIFYLKV